MRTAGDRVAPAGRTDAPGRPPAPARGSPAGHAIARAPAAATCDSCAMADIRPLTAIRYAPGIDLDAVVAPPYDVVDDDQRAALLRRSPVNIVAIDLPRGPDPYGEAARTFRRWLDEGVLVRDSGPALWAVTQDYTGPDGEPRIRSGFLAAVRVAGDGAGRIRPHERTHPDPKEDRLRLTRATGASLSPIFSLYADPDGRARSALAAATRGREPVGAATDGDGTTTRLWRVADPAVAATVADALRGRELLIADGHHRYETARAYAREAGTEAACWTLMFLVALEDPGLAVFPTHRLVRDRHRRPDALWAALRADFEIGEVADGKLAPPPGDGPLEVGCLDRRLGRPVRLRLRDQGRADAALASAPPPVRRLDTAVLEALVLKGALGLSDDDIAHLRGLGYARDRDEAVQLVTSGAYDVAFLLRPTPVEQVRAVAASGAAMPPKSTYFYPKIPSGLVVQSLR
jgi:uncharacterized protein (DUF1015 family)